MPQECAALHNSSASFEPAERGKRDAIRHRRRGFPIGHEMAMKPCLPLRPAPIPVHSSPSDGTLHAAVALFPAHPQGESARGRHRLAPADAARRHDPPAGGRQLFLAAAGQARARQGVPDRARGAGPRRRARDPDADDPVGRSVARERPLRRLRQGDAAHQGQARARHAVWADQRGNGHRDLPLLREVLQGLAAQPLSHPVEIPRRGEAAFRRHALTRIPDEGRLFLRPRLRGREGRLQPHVRLLSAHIHAHGPEGHSDARRYRADRRRSLPRVHHPGRTPAKARSIAIATFSTWRCPAKTPTSPTTRNRRHRRALDDALCGDRRDARRGGLGRHCRRRPTFGARHRGRPHLPLR